MKKFLSIILCLFLLIPCFTLGVFAAEEEEEEEELSNLSLDASLKASSFWNASTHPKAVINGASIDDIKAHMKWSGHLNYWQPDSPSHNGDSSIDPHLQWLQFTFKGQNKGYKLIDHIDIYTYVGGCRSQNTFTVKALINGIWVELGSIKNNEVVQLDECPDRAMLRFEMPDTVVVEGATCQVNTKTVKVECTNFGVDASNCGHAWDVPIIYEVEIWGKTGKIPEIDLHDGALLSTNAALSGQLYASSSATGKFPALAGDSYLTTSWKANAKTTGEWIMAEFDKPYDLATLEFNLSAADAVFDCTIDVEVKINDVWSLAETVTAKTDKGEAANVDVDISGKTTAVEAVRLTFKETAGNPATVAEIIATIADGKKCEFLFEYMTTNRKQSAANGNLAIYGEPYASTTFDHLGISDVAYINDGAIMDADFAWYAKTFAAGQYCGVTLDKELAVNKVTLYFNDGIIGGYDARDYFVLGYEVQAKINGEFKTVATGTNLDSTKLKSTTNDKYIVTIDFDEVTTDDIRIAFTETDIGFAFLKELEIYGPFKYDGYSTYAHGRRMVATTKGFSDPFIINRASFMEQVSPVQSMFFSINDIRASLWI